MQTIPPNLFAMMSALSENLVPACVSLLLAGMASIDAEPSGFVEGHLTIVSPKPVQPADENVTAETAENYADYPLVILSQDGQKEIARITADGDGNYRVALPPGN